uniref:Uncharacterized LOC109976785 n=1 Tax=Labrus bergylta TaxID=56723 RepID=A0A3Q3ECS9_9LABR|nr:uncharacterized protein LOC109976785 isoform X1 [Labrus bergylta]XP_029138470.1 uncharacterized protein LOC110004062 isoform X1 [Labrus bergylta]
MLFVLNVLMMLRAGRCMNHPSFDEKTAAVGDEVEMKCKLDSTGSYFWIRLGSGNFPEYLGKANGLDVKNSRITTMEQRDKGGEFILRMRKAELRDTGFYYCMRTNQRNLTFLTGTNLTVKDLNLPAAQPGDAAVRPPDPVGPGDSEKKQTCPGEHSACCFRAGSHQSHPRWNFTPENSVKGSERNPAGVSIKKCICSVTQNFSCSGEGTYFFAVDTCEEKTSGNRSDSAKQAVKEDSKTDHLFLLLLSAALAICLIIIAFLIYSIRKLKNASCGCCNADVALQGRAETASGDQQNQQVDEDSLIYSAPTFTSRKSGRARTRDVQTEEKESIYAHVRIVEGK